MKTVHGLFVQKTTEKVYESREIESTHDAKESIITVEKSMRHHRDSGNTIITTNKMKNHGQKAYHSKRNRCDIEGGKGISTILFIVARTKRSIINPEYT